MNVLSLFDGMSCGRVALERCGFKINKYYAAEIDKYAITVAANNYLDTIHVGDVTEVFAKDLEPIDIVIGGSPCQGFSFAGKQLNFGDPRSKLFFEFVRLVKECKPKYFFLENVVMKQEFQDVISSYLGVQPIKLNSALVSAQSRKRLYWTNIPGYTEPEDKGILLKDIVHEHCLTDRDKSHAIIGSIGRTTTREYFKKNQGQMVLELSASKIDRILNAKRGKGFFYDPKTHQKIGTLIAGYAKEPTDGSYLSDNGIFRKLTPIECERLQGLKDNYTLGVSNSQRYKMCGNGWQIDSIIEFFKHIPKDLDLF